MRIAVIDMGTNTFHLLIAEVTGSAYEVLYRDRLAVKIGEKGITEGHINPAAIERALKALSGFKSVIDEMEVERVFATATSAVRSAQNGEELRRLVREETGIEVRIISGDEEAEAIYYGVEKALPLGEEPSLIMDVGGGSIEFIIGNKDKIAWKQSFEMGGQRLLDLFHRSDPMGSKDLAGLKEYLEVQLAPLKAACLELQPRTLIGSSGTFDTLSDIYVIEHNLQVGEGATELPLTVEGFNKIHDQLITSTRSERLQIPGMIEMRVDMIVVATVLVKFIIDAMGIEHIRVSSYALKEGILMQIIASLAATKV